MNLCEVASNYAIDCFTSDLGDNTHNQFYDSLCDNVIPDDVSVWQPFEHCEADDLLSHIQDLTDVFIKFHKETTKCQ